VEENNVIKVDRLMQLDVESLIGTGRYERSDGRTTHRNGYRERDLETPLGTLELKIPKLGGCMPSSNRPKGCAMGPESC
jgi:transposase-like protein